MLWFIKKFLNQSFVDKNPGMLLFVPVAIVVLFAVRSTGDYISSYFPGYVGRQVVKQLRAELFAKYMHLPVGYYDRTSTGEMMSRLTYNIEMLADAATTALVNLAKDSLSFVDCRGRALLAELAARLDHHPAGAAPQLAASQDQPAVSPLQRPHPGVDGRYHSRDQGRARRPAGDQGLQRAGLRRSAHSKK